jgi:NAD-dependent deacetylase
VIPNIDHAAAMLARAQHPLLLTGAGVSIASGLAAYRTGPEAVWASFVMEWGTIERFREDPLAWWRTFWLRAHGDLVSDKIIRPNPAHHAVTQLLRHRPGAMLVTQNIDGLHRAAGAPTSQCVEIHGRADQFTCSNEGCRRHREVRTDVDVASLADEGAEAPECDTCGAPIRPVVLLFDETYDSHPAYRMPDVLDAMRRTDLVITAGTSFSVGITAILLQHVARYNLAAIDINPEAQDLGDFFLHIAAKAEHGLPALVEAMGWQGAPG